MTRYFEFEIVIVTWNRVDKLLRCLESIESAKQKDGSQRLRFNVAILINGPDQNALNELQKVQGSFSFQIQVATSDHRLFPGAARNHILRRCEKDWIFFLDDDAWLMKQYFLIFEKLVDRIETERIQYIAGPNLSADDSDQFSQWTQVVLENPIYVPFIYKRYAPQKKTQSMLSNPGIEIGAESKSILCNFWLKRSALNDAVDRFESNTKVSRKIFDDRLMGGEESELVHFMESVQAPGYYCSELAVLHERRKNLSSFFQQMVKYGEGRGAVIRFHGFYRWFHVAPVIALCIFLISVFFNLWQWTLFSYLVYFIIGLCVIATTRGFRMLPAGLLMPVVHFGYAMGVIKGILHRKT